MVLVQEAKAPEDIDRSDVESRLKEARNAMEEAEEGSEERSRYERNVKRLETFLDVAGN
jgi:F0F1-type ATP synthase epsilon subunit